MVNLFPAIRLRFKADPYVVRYCRRIYEGWPPEGEKAPLPCVQFYVPGAPEGLDGFDTDVEVRDLQFSLFGQADRSHDVHEMLRAFCRCFDDAKLRGADYTTMGMKRVAGPSGPTLIESVWQSMILYEWTGQLVALEPAVRFG